ncbi:hypothetical protein AURDEDRAFT_50894 [Auricularia subglabra TFB-10046 SS5]|nr:hypothetical protein AURDEDRAFT_50894 [Auricularia subglabra TFB-10046 SS5]
MATSVYDGPLRPQAHFSPAKNFMNDPCGCFQDSHGLWHLYYQYNPEGLVVGNQHWGHVTSRDLYHWREHPIALSPPRADSQAFDGSIVLDVNNTSGLFPSPSPSNIAAVYTLNTPTREVQHLAYSLDGGYSFLEYTGNPVIDSESTQFRDPKVSWHGETGKWVMVVAYAQDLTIGFYTSTNLRLWEHASNFSFPSLPGAQWECPNLVQLPVLHSPANEKKWVLKLSVNPGAPLGGSIDVHFVGAFNGTHFASSSYALADFAKDDYAAQSFYGAEDVSVAWASNWDYAQDMPTDREGWRSAMTLPRRNYLAQDAQGAWIVFQAPYRIGTVLGKVLAASHDLASHQLAVDFARVVPAAVYFRATVSGLADVYLSGDTWLNFTVYSPVSGESLSGSYRLAGGEFALDRGNTRGFSHPNFTPNFSMVSKADPSGRWKVEGIIDRSIVEVFLDGGKHVATVSYFPLEPLTLFTIDAVALPRDVRVRVLVWAVNSIWPDY